MPSPFGVVWRAFQRVSTYRAPLRPHWQVVASHSCMPGTPGNRVARFHTGDFSLARSSAVPACIPALTAAQGNRRLLSRNAPFPSVLRERAISQRVCRALRSFGSAPSKLFGGLSARFGISNQVRPCWPVFCLALFCVRHSLKSLGTLPSCDLSRCWRQARIGPSCAASTPHLASRKAGLR